MHVLAGLKEAALILAVAVFASLALATLWFVLDGGEVRHRLGLSLLLTGGLLAATSGSEMSRLGTLEARALLGSGPERGDRSSGKHLTSVGLLLVVCVPLGVAGAYLL